MSRNISIAVSCHTPHWHEAVRTLRQTIHKRVEDAQCSLLVLPEYAALEACLVGEISHEDDPRVWAARGASAHDLWVDILRDAAMAEGCYILAGSGPVARADTKIVNRAVLIAPDGSTGFQDKLIPTPWERNGMQLVGGETLRLFDTTLGKIGIAICYDAEFPAFSRAFAAAGADMILVPACTDTQAGQDRVEIAARARALENQCLVVHAPLLGDVPGCDPIDTNIGRAGFYGPPDWGQPPGGVHAQAHPETNAWSRAVPDLDAIARTRRDGDAMLFSDWSGQNVPDLPVDQVVLGK